MHRYLTSSLIFILAACNGSEDELLVHTVEDQARGTNSALLHAEKVNGATVIKMDVGKVRIATGGSAPARTPMNVRLYPGADIQTSPSGIDAGIAADRVVFNVDESAERIIEFYRNELESKDIMFKKEIRSGDTQTIGGERSDGEGIFISVTNAADGAATVTIVGSSSR